MTKPTWEQRWHENKTSWDLQGAHPLTQVLMEYVSANFQAAMMGRWLIPGCGRAHDGVILLKHGAAEVVARDLVPKATEEARKLYGGMPNFKLECANIFDLAAHDVGAFAGVFDRAMLCALSGIERDQYVKSVEKYLQAGGLFVSIPFAKTSQPESGPPFQITENQLRQQFNKDWKILRLESVVSAACDQKILGEWIFIAQRDQ